MNTHGRLQGLARAGYATKGAVYITLGVLSVQAALQGGSPEGSEGAIREIGAQPFGMVLLVLVAIGLAGYALWRGIQAALDPENVGDDAKGIATRIGYGLSCLSHSALCVLAIQLAIGSGGGGSDSKKTYAAELMQVTLGQVAIAIAGVVLIGFGLRQLYRAKTTDFTQTLALGQMSAHARTAAVWSGRLGLSARGVVFPIMGYFLIRAALTTDPSKVKGLQGALQEVSSSTFGSVLLLIVAVGLAAYGVFQLVQARYRRIPSDSALSS